MVAPNGPDLPSSNLADYVPVSVTVLWSIMRNSLEYRIKETLPNTGNQEHQLAQQRAWFYSFYPKGYRSGTKGAVLL